ncbi:Chimeric ERCC6-PGBD3 protein [Pseudolycoriella hygida]|uniref:Chimeric ERCC6-PGBD3 protein n=1 Tax=Pseudolycoriella hygida TaxID=35572 RepID=A0A9Q0S8I7_9DIPT|nr:Chimeric ERCC6-PGBD3 protein [Pseudolycoriella hygida]
MGGTDRTDENVNAYRISIRGKKWWWCIFTWLLDVSVQNAWQLARKANPKLVQLQFRRNLAMSYMSAHSQHPKSVGRRRKISSDDDTTRFDKIGHFVRNTLNKKQRRCRGNNCKSKVRTECLKCDVGLVHMFSIVTMKIGFVLLITSCVIGFGQSSVFDKTIPFAETNLVHTGFDKLFNAAAGTNIGCLGCPFYRGGNCFECCVQHGYSSGGSCGGFLFATCFCVGTAR